VHRAVRTEHESLRLCAITQSRKEYSDANVPVREMRKIVPQLQRPPPEVAPPTSPELTLSSGAFGFAPSLPENVCNMTTGTGWADASPIATTHVVTQRPTRFRTRLIRDAVCKRYSSAVRKPPDSLQRALPDHVADGPQHTWCSRHTPNNATSLSRVPTRSRSWRHCGGRLEDGWQLRLGWHLHGF